MSIVEQALKSAIDALTVGRGFYDAINQCKAALAELEKCEPVIIEEHYKKDSYGRFIWVNSAEGYDLKITYQDGVAIKAEVAE